MVRRAGAPVTTGVLGQTWRGSVTAWGAVEPWYRGRPLDWYVAADDRWHVPRDEASVRQRRVEGTPVVETRIRVPSGDVVSRVSSVADLGGLTVIEVHNDSPLPVAVAFDRRDVLTNRPPSEVPPMGIDLPEGSIVVPVGHQGRVRVALAHDGRGPGVLPGDVPDSEAVTRGWLARSERASRLTLPDDGDPERVVAERSELSLIGPDDPADDPVGCVLGVAELVRMGDDAAPWVPDVATAIELVARRPGWDVDAALVAGARVFAAAGERRALDDVSRIVAARTSVAALPVERPDGVRLVAWIEGRIAGGGTLLPCGLDASWYGANVEVRGVPVGPSTTLSFALRWHGERVAILWEQSGPPVTLRAPLVDASWSSNAPSGEALWRPPPRPSPPPSS